MRVKELIAALQQHDPEAVVLLVARDRAFYDLSSALPKAVVFNCFGSTVPTPADELTHPWHGPHALNDNASRPHNAVVLS